MKAQITIKKIMEAQFQEALQRMMKKWPEAKDIHALVKIAKANESEVKAYQETIKKLEESVGYEMDGRKSANAQDITGFLLQEYGRFAHDGNLTMTGVAEEESEAFLAQKKIADECLRNFDKEHKAIIESEIEFEFPRRIVVEEKHLRKEVISAMDCFILEPILDLSKVSDLKEEPQPE